MQPAMKRLFVLLGVTLLLSGCAELAQYLNQYIGNGQPGFKQPTLTLRSANITNVNLGGLSLDTTWQLDNPNPLGLSLSSIEYALFVDGHQVIAGAPPNGLQLPANGSAELRFPANVKFVDLGGVVETFLTRDRARYRVQGSVGMQTPIGELKLPLATEGDFEVPKVPQVQLGNPRVTNLSFTGATVEFPLTVTNRNGFPMPISQVSGTISVAGAPLGTLSTGDLGQMTAKGARQVALPLQVNFLSAAGAAVTAIRGGNAQVQFNAAVSSGGIAVPMRVDQLVNFLH